MGQPIFCDMDECKAYADVLITHLENGNVEAFCHAHYFEFVMQMAVHLIPPDTMPPEDGAEQKGDQDELLSTEHKAKSKGKKEKLPEEIEE